MVRVDRLPPEPIERVCGADWHIVRRESDRGFKPGDDCLFIVRANADLEEGTHNLQSLPRSACFAEASQGRQAGERPHVPERAFVSDRDA